MTDDVLVQNQTGSEALPHIAVQESLIPQDKVNYLVTQAKAEAYERAKREAGSQQQQNQTLSNQEIERLIDQKASERLDAKFAEFQQTQMDRQVAEQIVGKWTESMKNGESAYEDFKDVAGVFDMAEDPKMVALLSSVPNIADVMYEFGKNPEKYSDVAVLLHSKQTKAAERAILKLSDSIAANKKAKADAEASKEPAPLGQLKPSTARTMAVGEIKTQSEMKAAINAIRRKR
jgi:hypothetical protein